MDDEGSREMIPWRHDEIPKLFIFQDSHSQAQDHQSLGSTRVEECLPPSPLWRFKASKIQQELPSINASSLMTESLEKFRCLSFELLIKSTSQTTSPSMTKFLQQYQALSSQIYGQYFKCRFTCPDYCEKLAHVLENLILAEADPFILAAVKNAHHCILNNRFIEPDLRTPLELIVEPLKTVIQNPDQTTDHIGTKLKILENRFYRYHSESTVKWEAPFNIRTELFENLRLRGPLSFAKRLSAADASLYRQLSIDSFKENGNTEAIKTLKDLNIRSDRLFQSVIECLDTGVVSSSEIMELIMHLYNLRNFYSMVSVMRAVKSSSHRPGIANLFFFPSPRQLLAQRVPALHSISSACMGAQRKRFHLAKAILESSATYFVDGCGLRGDEALESNVVLPPEPMLYPCIPEKSGELEGESSGPENTSFWDFFCFKASR